jgi:hypothetical protein
MDTLIDVWTRANKLVVDYPLISTLATILLSFLSLFFRRVREAAKRWFEIPGAGSRIGGIVRL